MVRPHRTLLGVGLVLAILLLSGCKGPPPSKVGFMNRLAEYNEKLFAIGRKFRTAIAPLAYPGENKKESNHFDPNEVRRVQTEAENQVREIRDDFDDMVSPRKSPPGAKLREAYEEFLVIQERIAREHMVKIVSIIDEKNASNDDKASRVREVMDKIEADEREVTVKLADAQKKYTSAHSLKADAGALLGVGGGRPGAEPPPLANPGGNPEGPKGGGKAK